MHLYVWTKRPLDMLSLEEKPRISAHLNFHAQIPGIFDSFVNEYERI
jgi:hypothetical protein